MSRRFSHILDLAKEYAEIEKSPLVEEKHILQAFFEDGEGVTVEILKGLTIELPSNAREDILSMRMFTKSTQKM